MTARRSKGIDWQGRILAGRFEVGPQLGRGGMAIIYRARDRTLERDVAIKILRSDRDGGQEHRDRLRREAMAIARLNHPHIVTVHDVGVVDEVVYIVMELLEGADVAELLETEGRLALPLALEIGRQVCSGLAIAHASDVIHRDIKPENIFVIGSISGAIAKVLDFSVAKVPLQVGRKRLTRSGSILGTPHYMAPEQIRADPVSPQTDLYGLGAVLYEMVTGAPPYDAPTPLELFELHITADVPDLDERIPDAPAGLSRLVRRLLAKKPEDRPTSAQEVSEQLSQMLTDSFSPRDPDPATITGPITVQVAPKTAPGRAPEALKPDAPVAPGASPRTAPARKVPAKARPGPAGLDRTAEMTDAQIAKAAAELNRPALPHRSTLGAGSRVRAPGAVRRRGTPSSPTGQEKP